MKLIKISESKSIALEHITAVSTLKYSKMSKPADIDFGLKSKPKKNGEKVIYEITTSDGVTHKLDEKHSEMAKSAIFPE